MLQHCTADHLPGVFSVRQHDALVHDHTLRGLRGRLPGYPDDVEVWSLVRIRGWLLCFITFTGGTIHQTGVKRRGGQWTSAGQSRPDAVIETTRHRQFPVRKILFLHGTIRLTQHWRRRWTTARHRACDRIILSMIDNWGYSSFKPRFFTDIGTAGVRMCWFYLTRQFVSFIFIHDENWLEPASKSWIRLNCVGISCSLQ